MENVRLIYKLEQHSGWATLMIWSLRAPKLPSRAFCPAQGVRHWPDHCRSEVRHTAKVVRDACERKKCLGMSQKGIIFTPKVLRWFEFHMQNLCSQIASVIGFRLHRLRVQNTMNAWWCLQDSKYALDCGGRKLKMNCSARVGLETTVKLKCHPALQEARVTTFYFLCCRAAELLHSVLIFHFH